MPACCAPASDWLARVGFNQRKINMMDLQVTGMSCNHCANAVKQAIAEVDSSSTVEIDLATGNVKVQTRADAQAIKTAIVEAGYEVTA
jgi:copper chaperone